MATGPHTLKLWRSIGKERSASTDTIRPSVEDYTFGMKAPIVDFFDHDYITKFAPLEGILGGKLDEIMEEAYKQDPIEESYFPITSGGYKFRRIHIPANNMVCWCNSYRNNSSSNTLRVIHYLDISLESTTQKKSLLWALLY